MTDGPVRPPTLGVDAAGLKALARDLRAAKDREGQRQLRRAMKESADVVAAAVRSGTAWSTRIPGTVKATSSVSRANVRYGGPKAPHAAANEKATFRHPVFGNRNVWVEQQGHPAGVEALDGHADEVANKLADALVAIWGGAGFR